MTRQNKSRRRRLIYDYKRLLRRLERGAEFVAFDVETTGLSAAKCRIIELGAVRFSKDGILGSFHSLVDPKVPLPSIITTITGITEDMLSGRPEIRYVLRDFLEFAKGSWLVAHNAGFDTKMLNAELERSGMPASESLVIDTLHFSRKMFPELEKHSLQFLAAALKIDVRSAHRADDDARVCMELFNLCVSRAARLRDQSDARPETPSA